MASDASALPHPHAEVLVMMLFAHGAPVVIQLDAYAVYFSVIVVVLRVGSSRKGGGVEQVVYQWRWRRVEVVISLVF